MSILAVGSIAFDTIRTPFGEARDIVGGSLTYFQYDGLGSTANLTDGSGTTTGTYSYDVFGALRSPSPSSKNEFRFTGEQQDPQGNRNFYYLRARYYDPATGRFLSQDPLPLRNRYAYVRNNPLNFVDPYGLIDLTPDFVDEALDEVAGVAGSAAEVAGDAIEVTADAVAHAATAASDATVSAALATWDVAQRFGTLNCLVFAIDVAGIVVAGFAPQLTPGIALGLQLLHAGVIISDRTAFAFSTAVNFSQINTKEGLSFNNLTNATSVLVSGAAVLTATSGTGLPFLAQATALDAVQCAGDVF